MKRGLPAAILFLLLLAFALVTRSGSPGARIAATLREYIDRTSSGEYEQAHAILTDSLGRLLTPEFLRELGDTPSAGAIELVHWETRGFVAYLRLAEGGSRTFWFRREDGEWRISGDTSLDNLLGRAASLCRSYAEDAVVPSLREGIPADAFSCPVTGADYSTDPEGRLVCPSSHLGTGLDIRGDRCTVQRDSLALVISGFVAEGGSLPSSFGELYTLSEGLYGQPGGFRCPDHGYSYYLIENGSVYCPWHEEAAVIPLTEP